MPGKRESNAGTRTTQNTNVPGLAASPLHNKSSFWHLWKVIFTVLQSYQRSGVELWSHFCGFSLAVLRGVMGGTGEALGWSPLALEWFTGDGWRCASSPDGDLDLRWQLMDSNAGIPVKSPGTDRLTTITDLSVWLRPPIWEAERSGLFFSQKSRQITSHFDSCRRRTGRLSESAARQKMWREVSRLHNWLWNEAKRSGGGGVSDCSVPLGSDLSPIIPRQIN